MQIDLQKAERNREDAYRLIREGRQFCTVELKEMKASCEVKLVRTKFKLKPQCEKTLQWYKTQSGCIQ